MRYFQRLLIAFALVIFIAGCSEGGGGGNAVQKEETLAPSVDNAFSIGSKETDAGTFITIKKDALETNFLLQSSVSDQKQYGNDIGNPTTHALKSHVITFKDDGNQLVMLELSNGTQPGKEIPAHILMATFPVVKRSEDSLIFDFNKGMKEVVVKWDWFASDDASGKTIKPDYAISVEDSYLRSIKTYPNAISIVQTMSVKEGTSLFPMETVYYISQYKNNSAYTPVKSPGFSFLGYFETNPLVLENHGSTYTNITMWDISKPLIYYLSQDIPEKYREAAKEGVLYWNKVFGKEVLKVDVAPKDITAPDFEHNIIQWNTRDKASAYADANVDPLTGEILHAQIFINSISERFRGLYIPKLDRNLDEEKKSENKYSLTATQLQETMLCNIELSDLFKGLYLHRDIIQTLPADRLDAITNDIIRDYIAHEVGHTLGLRHNFAGSTLSDLRGKEEQDIVRSYLKDGKLPSDLPPPANSVMEYAAMPDDFIIGAMIGKKDFKPFPYDVYAIQWGYFGSDKPPKYNGLLFCTDTQVGLYEDCAKYDSGKHLVERRAFETMDAFDKIPWLVSEFYLATKTSVTPTVKYVAGSVYAPWANLTKLLTDDIGLLSILAEYPDLSDIDSGKIEEQKLDWLNSEIKFAGGIDSVLKLIDPKTFRNTIKDFPAQFKKIVASDNFKKALTAWGENFKLTDSQVNYMTGRADEIFYNVEDELAYYITAASSAGSFRPIEEAEKAEAIIAKWAEHLITTGTKSKFNYSFSTRNAAVNLLFSKGPFRDWLESYIPDITEKLRTQLESTLGISIIDINIESFPRGEQQHVLDEIELYKKLAGKTAAIKQ